MPRNRDTPLTDAELQAAIEKNTFSDMKRTLPFPQDNPFSEGVKIAQKAFAETHLRSAGKRLNNFAADLKALKEIEKFIFRKDTTVADLDFSPKAKETVQAFFSRWDFEPEDFKHSDIELIRKNINDKIPEVIKALSKIAV